MDGGIDLLRRGARRALGRGRLGAAAASVRRTPVAPPLGQDDVTLERVDVRRREVLANLVQLYRHDMAELRGFELTEAGTYDYPYLDEYLTSDDREAWLIRAEERLAGFVLTRRLPDGVWQISEHFVARSCRGRGAGRIALGKAFALHEGGWTCFVDEDNGTSRQMCTGAVADVGAEGARTSRGVSTGGSVGTVFRFAVPARGRDEGSEDPGPVTCC